MSQDWLSKLSNYFTRKNSETEQSRNAELETADAQLQKLVAQYQERERERESNPRINRTKK